MEIIVFIIVWLILGAIGSYLLFLDWISKFNSLDLGTLIILVVYSLFGPFTTVIGILALSVGRLGRNELMQTEIWRKKRDTRNKN